MNSTSAPTHSTPRSLLILILGALCTVGPFSIDMYLPAFPEIAHALGTTVAQVSLSVSTYFIGLALGQVFYGPLLDRFGRKRPLYAGLSIYVIATLACMSARTVEALLVFRFFQAIGGCAASVAATAMVRDFFPVEQSARIFSLLMLILGVSPLLAPTIGGWVVVAFGWQSVFGVLAVIVTMILAVVFFFLPEGHHPDPTIELRPGPIFRGFREIFRVPQFAVYAIAGSFSFAGLFVYITGSPGIFMEGFKLSAQAYGAVFAILSVGFIGGSQLNLLLGRRYTSRQIFGTALALQVVFAAIFLAGSLIGTGFGAPGTVAILFCILSCAGLTSPNAGAIALAPFSKNAGSASALLGLLQMGLGALASAGVGMLGLSGGLATATVITVTSAAGLLILRLNSSRLKGLNEPASIRD